jgi:hypothetical protein
VRFLLSKNTTPLRLNPFGCGLTRDYTLMIYSSRTVFAITRISVSHCVNSGISIGSTP